MTTQKKNVKEKREKTREEKLLEAARKSSRSVAAAKAFLISAGIITEDGELAPIYK